MNTADVLYHGWNTEDMREAGDVASCAHASSSPGFTAINQCSPHPSSLHQDVAVLQDQSVPVHVLGAGKSSRRNPNVASYLGLGDCDEPAHLVMFAPIPDSQPPQPQSTRKRRSPRNSEKAPSRKKPAKSDKAASSQRHRSEIIRATKLSTQSDAYKINESTDEHLATPVATAPCAKKQQIGHEGHPLQSIDTDRDPAPRTETSIIHSVLPDDDDDDDFGQLCFDFDTHTCDADNTLHSTHVSNRTEPSPTQFDNNDLDDDLMDADLLGLTSDLSDDSIIPQLQSIVTAAKCPVVPKSIRHTPTPNAPVNTGVAANDECSSSSPASSKFVSPVILTTRLLAASGDEAQKPIVRPPFPAAVRDRSPIIGLSSSTLLRSCFRVGEAISQSYHAAKAGHNIVIELYARVLDSERDDTRQRFTFCDLFHARPPYIQATYAAAIWKTVQLFEYDSARLMQQGRICRCIGTMKRNDKDWVMTVSNIWEATWDDVQWVEGIVSS